MMVEVRLRVLDHIGRVEMLIARSSPSGMTVSAYLANCVFDWTNSAWIFVSSHRLLLLDVSVLTRSLAPVPYVIVLARLKTIQLFSQDLQDVSLSFCLIPRQLSFSKMLC